MQKWINANSALNDTLEITPMPVKSANEYRLKLFVKAVVLILVLIFIVKG